MFGEPAVDSVDNSNKNTREEQKKEVYGCGHTRPLILS
jgi:hypothetical protein